ncbi:MAG: hypothetical protein LIP02_11540 [Bacteroidales bacterium]|nr:hypothetical protein [Bacteroidales bacterium]
MTIHNILLTLALMVTPLVSSSATYYTLTFTAPAEATVFVGQKSVHYVPFSQVESKSRVVNGDQAVYTYSLKGKGYYNYRVSLDGAVTTAGMFRMPASDHEIAISRDDIPTDPYILDRDPASNSGYNVADLYLNADYTGCVSLTVGQQWQIVNQRAWQIVDTVINNYYLAPDYDYAVYDLDGNPCDEVVEVSADGVVTAKSSGVALILVTFRALNAPTQEGGPIFGAIWPENTGVIVVEVDLCRPEIA